MTVSNPVRLKPGDTIGILGGGQLGRMLAMAAARLGLRCRVFSPDPAEVAFARRIVEAMPDGTGAVMIDGKMQDDATWKQARVLVDLARLVAAKDPELGAAYALA